MTSKKQNSTNQVNSYTIMECPVSFTLGKIGGRWKTAILYTLKMQGPVRFGKLKKMIPLITEKMLAQQLRELETDNLVIRDAKPIIPLHVEYSLTMEGQELSPIFFAMSEWGKKNNPLYKDCE